MPSLGKTNNRSYSSKMTLFDSIKFRITFWSIIIGSIPALFLGIFAIQHQTNQFQQKARESQERILGQKLNYVENFFEQVRIDLAELSGRHSLQSLVANGEGSTSLLSSVQQDTARLMQLSKRYSQFQILDLSANEIIHVKLVKETGSIVPKKDLKNLADESYVGRLSALEKGGILAIPEVISEPGSGGKGKACSVIRFGTPIFSAKDEKIGTLVLTSITSTFLDQFNDIPNGSITLVDSTGVFLYQTGLGTEDIANTLKAKENFQDYYSHSIFEDMKQEEKGFIAENSKDYLSFEKLHGKSVNLEGYWVGIYSIHRSLVLNPISEFRTRFAWLVLAAIFLVFLAARFFCERLTRPLLQLVKMAESVAQGNLELEKIDCKSNDEIGILSKSFESMVSILRNYMLSITKTAKVITGSSSELSATVQEQSAITAQQSTSLTEITATLEELSTSSSQIAENSNAVVEISATALNQAEQGMDAIEVIKDKMDQIAEDNRVSTNEIVELGKKSKEVGKVMEIINDIADQTKLIAFNAAIEASSAGSAGKRFEVVAIEIRRLADSVMSSIEEIGSITAEIQRGINGLVIASEKGANRVEEGTQLAAQTLSQLENLVTGAKSANEASTQISLSTRQQKSATNQVLNALKEIEQGFLEIAASIKESSNITNQLTDSSSDLKELIEEYQVTQ